MQEFDSAEKVIGYLENKYSLTGLTCLSWKVKVSGFSFFEGFQGTEKIFIKWGGKTNNCLNDYEYTKKFYSINSDYFFRPVFCEIGDDISCFAMGYEDFKTLKEAILKNCLKNEEKESIILNLVEIAKILREYGCVHRDIKPDNIAILENGAIKLFDFEFATDGLNYSEREEFLRHPDLVSCVGTNTECGVVLGPGRFIWDDMFSFRQLLKCMGNSESYKDAYENAFKFFTSHIGERTIRFPGRIKLIFKRRFYKILAVLMPLQSWRHKVRMQYRKPLY